jgi:thymidylate kinase
LIQVHLPRVIYIFGVDGSGKSTICRELVQTLAGQGVKSRYLWMRFNHFFSKMVNALGHLCGLAFYVTYSDGSKVGYHHYHKSRFIRFVYPAAAIADTYLAKILKIWLPSLVNRDIFVVDRFIYDVMVDLTVDTHNPGVMEAWQGKMLQKMLPRDTLTVYLSVDKEIIARRRPDTQRDTTFGLRNSLYGRLLEFFPGILRIDNNGDMRIAINRILGEIKK